MKVFLDDERTPPAGWILAKTPKQTIDLLKSGRVTELSLDHDLGGDDTIGTGYDVLLWLEEQVYLHHFKAPSIIKVHSSNASARGKMEQAIRSIQNKSNLGEIKMRQSDLRRIVKEEIGSIMKEFEDDEQSYDDEPYDKASDDYNRDLDQYADNPTISEKNRSVNYLFTVPNDQDGLKKIQRAKEGLKDVFYLKLRGRHHDRKEVLGDKWRPGTQNEIPVKQAEFIAVYVTPKK